MNESTFEESATEWSVFMTAITDQTPLGEVLIVAAYLDEQLLRILKAFLVTGRVPKEMTSGPSAPLGSFSARTAVAYAMGLLSKLEFDTINAIRGIRNEFAPNMRADFSSPKVQGKLNALLWVTGQEQLGTTDPHQIFYLASQRTAMALLNRADHAKLARLTERDWDHRRTDFDPDYDPY